MSSTFIFSVMNMETKSVRDNVVFLIDLSVCQFVVRNDQWENADRFFSVLLFGLILLLQSPAIGY
uniref:Uncharacterized protein n=1 Tax=Anguilla anguilla TaxID=7936 RepID=A0A0E9RYD2_ANGAN